jgi:hypothetical protein
MIRLRVNPWFAFLVIPFGLLTWGSVAVAVCTVPAAVSAKWHKQPPARPDATITIDPIDPRAPAVSQYLEKTLQRLAEDQKKYPGLRDQISALVDDITALNQIPVSDPAYAEKFAEFHASFTALLVSEGDDSI